MSEKLLFVCRHAPYGRGIAREGLDAILAAAAYGQDIGVLFIDDGVFQLLPNQAPGALPQKNLAANLSALPLYDVERLYVHSESLQERGLKLESLNLEGLDGSPALRAIGSDEVGQLFSQHKQLLSF